MWKELVLFLSAGTIPPFNGQQLCDLALGLQSMWGSQSRALSSSGKGLDKIPKQASQMLPLELES